MKHELNSASSARLFPRWRTALGTGLAAAGLFCAAILPPAFGDGRKPDGPPAFAAGDETIGTLPILQGPDTIDLRRDLSITQPSLCLEGDLNEILNSIVLVRGQPVAQLMSVGTRGNRVRLVFPGNVQLGFDRLMIESSSIRIGMWMPESAHSKTFGSGAQFLDLPVLAMSAAGALSYNPLQAHAEGSHGPTYLTAATNPDFLILRQGH